MNEIDDDAEEGAFLGFAQAVKRAVARDLTGGEWAGFVFAIDEGEPAAIRGLMRALGPGMQFARDAVNDADVMRSDHTVMCSLGEHWRGHPAAMRWAASLRLGARP